MSLAISFHFSCAQHVSDINISILRNLRRCCWIIASVTSGCSFILQLLKWCMVEWVLVQWTVCNHMTS